MRNIGINQHNMKSWKKVHYTALAFVMTVAATLPAFAADWASVIMYHRFGESKYPTSLSASLLPKKA